MMAQPDQYGGNGGKTVYNTSSIANKDEEVRIVLLGRTGSGKSSSGNTILNKNEFPSSLSAVAVTRECKRGTCTRFGRRLQVIDTPGVYDTEMKTDEKFSQEVVRCVEMTSPGVHAFLFVVRVERFTEEEQNTVEYFMKLFGRGMLDYLIILITKKDDLTYSGQTIEDYIGNDSSKLKSVLKDCAGRYVAFNNRGSLEEKEQDVQTLVEVIDKMVQDNGGKVYTKDMFQEHEKAMKEKEDQLKREYEEAIKSQLGDIRRQTSQLRKNREDTDQMMMESDFERDYPSSTSDYENAIKQRRKGEHQTTWGIGAGETEVDLRDEEHREPDNNGSCLKAIRRGLQALWRQARTTCLIAFGFGAFFFVLHRLGLKEKQLSE